MPPTTPATAPRTAFHRALATPRERLLQHRVYGLVVDAPTLRRFMCAHAFAVWDFQSLLKALQREVTCVDVPWLPAPDPEACRLINEIVLAEESDPAPGGGHLSHYELYLAAMHECGADTGPIEAFVDELRAGLAAGRPAAAVIERALRLPGTPPGVRAFVGHTLELARSRAPHRIAAAFAFGREEIIPAMFQRLVASLDAGTPGAWSTLRYYLERHIECDGDEHGPAAERLLASLCGDDSRKWSEAADAARAALAARQRLWDRVAHTLEAS